MFLCGRETGERIGRGRCLLRPFIAEVALGMISLVSILGGMGLRPTRVDAPKITQ
jgi:hypothetical protein